MSKNDYRSIPPPCYDFIPGPIIIVSPLIVVFVPGKNHPLFSRLEKKKVKNFIFCLVVLRETTTVGRLMKLGPTPTTR